MKSILILLLVVFIAGCASTKHLDESNFDKNVLDNAALDKHLEEGEVNRQWWLELDDPDLQELFRRLLEDNHDIRIAAQRVASLRATSSASTLQQFPRLTSQAGYADERQSLNRADFVVTDRDIETYNAGVNFDWELDVFRRVNRQAKVDRALYEVQLADQAAVKSMLIAEMLQLYVQLRKEQLQRRLLVELKQHLQERVSLIEKLHEVGASSEIDVLQTQTNLSSVQREILIFDDSLQRVARRIQSIVGGKLIDGIVNNQVDSLPSLPESVVVSSASELLRTRPDIVASRKQLEASILEYKILHSNWWPTISLTGSVGYVATDFNDISKSTSATRVFNPNIQWSGLNFLSLRAKIKSADAQAHVRLLEYEQTVIRAVGEVRATAQGFVLAQEKTLLHRNEFEMSKKQLSLVKQRYEAGVDNKLDLLAQQERHVRASLSLLNEEESLIAAMASVFRTLGS